VGFLWFLFAFTSAFWTSSPASAGVNSFLSQTKYEFSRGEACHKDASVVAPPRGGKVTCAPKDPHQDVSELSESLFFDGAAQEYINRNRCWDQKISTLDAPKKEALVAQVKDYLPMVADLSAQIRKVQLQRYGYVHSESTSSSDEDRNRRISGKIAAYDAQEDELNKQLHALLSTSWFGGNAIAQQALARMADKSPEALEKYLGALDVTKLETDLLNPVRDASLHEQSKLLQTTPEGIALSQKMTRARTKILNSPELNAGKNGFQSGKLQGLVQAEYAEQKKLDLSKLHFDLADEQKIKLFRENGLGDYLLKRDPQEFKHYANLYCRLDGRFGKGRESYEKAKVWIEVGASVLLPMAPYALAARGAWSLRTATLLSSGGSGAAGMYNLYDSLKDQCGDQAVAYKVGPSCNEAETSAEAYVQELSDGSCVAGVALAGLQFTMPLALKSLAKLRSIRVPGIKPSNSASPPVSAEIRSVGPRKVSDSTRLQLEKEAMKKIPLEDYIANKKVIQWGNENLYAKMEKPQSVNLRINEDDFGPNFDSEAWRFNRPTAKDLGFERDAVDAIDAHEYGHAIFTKNMEKYSEEWKKWQEESKRFYTLARPEYERIENEYLKIENQYRDLRRREKRYKDPKQLALVEQKLEELRAQMRDFQDHLHDRLSAVAKGIDSPSRPKIADISDPYQEVYSDLAGSLQSRDFERYRHVMTEATKSSFQKDGSPELLKQMQADRAFNQKVPLEGWNERVKNLRKEDHYILNPVRSFLYENYLSKPQNMERMNEFMPKLFDSIAKEVVAQSKNSKFSYTDSEALNRSLIQRLKGDLKDFEK
jgi:hypothetical protein